MKAMNSMRKMKAIADDDNFFCLLICSSMYLLLLSKPKDAWFVLWLYFLWSWTQIQDIEKVFSLGKVVCLI